MALTWLLSLYSAPRVKQLQDSLPSFKISFHLGHEMKGKSGKHHKTYLKTPKAEVEERRQKYCI